MHSHNNPSYLESDASFLAVDTAFDVCSVALITPMCVDFRSSERYRKHADDVLPLIGSLLSAHSCTLASLDFVAMVSGPGSFTGLRIGTAVVQGLAFGAELPVVCVSSLAMMARSARRQTSVGEIILTCLHAREDEFYFAVYQDSLTTSPLAVLSDTIFTSKQITQYLDDFNTKRASADDLILVLAGPGWQHESLFSHVTKPYRQVVSVNLDARLLAELSLQHYWNGNTLSAESATPAYLKDDMEYRTV